METLDSIAPIFAELGHPTRLAIFHHLVKAGDQGIPVGDVQQALAIPASTLSHHLSKLIHVGLVSQRRESRTLYCVPQYEPLFTALNYLQQACCSEIKPKHDNK